MLRPLVLRVTCAPVAWTDVASRLRPFVARRVDAVDVDDVLQDVFVRMHRGLDQLRADERMSAWLFQIARSAIADHGRSRARHPLAPDAPTGDDATPAEDALTDDDDREASRALAGCVAIFVARLPSPYREAVTLVELEGLTAREAAALAGISVSGMKSRVQRGRAQLRTLFEDCCRIALDVRGKVTGFERRPPAPCEPGAGSCAPPRARD